MTAVSFHGKKLCKWSLSDIPEKNNPLVPGTSNNQLKMDVWWFPTISYVKIGNHPIDSQPFINGWPWGSRWKQNSPTKLTELPPSSAMMEFPPKFGSSPTFQEFIFSGFQKPLHCPKENSGESKGTTQSYPPQEIVGLIKGLLTIGFP